MFRAFFFRRPATPESAATRSLPRGGGLGRGHSPNFGNLSQQLNHRNTSLSACCPLSSSLPWERGRVAVGAKGSAKKQVVQAAFPILATRTGFPPVRRLSAAKSRGSKNAVR